MRAFIIAKTSSKQAVLESDKVKNSQKGAGRGTRGQLSANLFLKEMLGPWNMEVFEQLSKIAWKVKQYEFTLKLVLVSASVTLLAPLLFIKPFPALDITLALTSMAIVSWSGGLLLLIPLFEQVPRRLTDQSSMKERSAVLWAKTLRWLGVGGIISWVSLSTAVTGALIYFLVVVK